MKIFRAICACVLVCLSALAVHAQTPVSISPYPKMQLFDNNGAPLAGGFVFTYVCATTTPLATYQDSSGVYQNTNPIVLDSSGRGNIWLAESCYKFVVQNSLGVQLYVVDGVQPFPTSFPNITTGTLTSAANSPALSGFIRMASADQICWRNNANSADVCLSKNTSDQLLYGGQQLVTAGSAIFGVLGFTSVSGFQTTFNNFNTSNQLVTFPNATGTVCLVNDCPLVSPSFNNVTIGAGIGTGTVFSSTGGALSSYANIDTLQSAAEFHGLAVEASGATADLTGSCPTTSASTIYTAGSTTNRLRFNYYLDTAIAGSAGTWSITLMWTHNGDPYSFTSSTLSLTSLSAFVQGNLIINADGGTAVRVGTTNTSGAGGPACAGFYALEVF